MMASDEKKVDEDEAVVRTFLQSRAPFWPQLPYDWMGMSDEDMDDLNLLEMPAEVREAYDRSRADPEQRATYSGDYERQDITTAWLEKLEAELRVQPGS